MDVFTGLKRGIQLIGDFMKEASVALRTGNVGEGIALASIAETWISEALDIRGLVKGNLITNMLVGVDVFAGSRHEFETYKQAKALAIAHVVTITPTRAASPPSATSLPNAASGHIGENLPMPDVGMTPIQVLTDGSPVDMTNDVVTPISDQSPVPGHQEDN